jgi:DNA (cytosine-5)-methyltransferase 1
MAPRPIHPTRDRVISVREAARLHSFPNWFRFNATKWHGFRQIGNALPPLLGRVIGAEVVNAMAIQPKKPT